MKKTTIPSILWSTLIVCLMGCSQTTYRLQTNINTQAVSSTLLSVAAAKEQQLLHAKQVTVPRTHYCLTVEEIKEVEVVNDHGQKVKQLCVVFVASKSIK
ncbi:hypothetical protein [Candidatus Cardinium hertigii]|jgi:hypothetical protein|uniref:Uncharacterized protein n=1 Tax=Candidatus Cardinium hertigii TaxID=247481 RepID=A0A3N2QCT5_9BACT|nr:hypothetical protein [Candidatus Cardinium hertigii]ROT47489.1 hypothetical protein EDM02_02445 [Candidatus Cardinium hertigii]